ncbi:MAG: helix-turn-helix transcriptional regulator [Candidatus Izemoplasmatales bacterium]|nr:helix-turn-helix transcriptional regulator [Candidatus Izemoplasmatales bacterium]
MDLGKHIKELRNKNYMTQEVLAEILGTSVQSISRWENSQTYPDISMLPIIANVFDVTIDQLLNYDINTNTNYVQELLSKDEKLANLGDSIKRIELYREGLKKYPNNYVFMQKLAGVLLGFYYADDTNRKDVLLEVIKLSEKVVTKCSDVKVRSSASQTLCFAYYHNGEMEKAKEIANGMPSIHSSKERLLESILSGEEKQLQLQDNTLKLIEWFHSIILGSREKDPEHNIKLYKKYISLLDVVFEEYDFGFYNIRLFDAYLGLARNYARLDDVENTVNCLDTSLDYAIAYQRRPTRSKHKSLLVDKLFDEKDKTSKNTTITEKHTIIIELEKEIFNFVKNHVKYQSVLTKIKDIK